MYPSAKGCPTATAVEVEASNAIALCESLNIRADFDDNTSRLMRSNEGKFRVERIFKGHTVSMTKAARLDLN